MCGAPAMSGSAKEWNDSNIETQDIVDHVVLALCVVEGKSMTRIMILCSHELQSREWVHKYR
jgi:hypothetical protein